MVNLIRRLVGDPNERALKELWPVVRKAEEISDTLQSADLMALRDRTQQLRASNVRLQEIGRAHV